MLATAMTCVACGSGGKKGNGATAGSDATENAGGVNNVAGATDCQGVYKGTLPAADCPGIGVTLELKADGTFKSVYDYQERDASFENQGTYALVDGLLVTVGEQNDSTFYKVEAEGVRQLDGDRQVIPGEIGKYYVLTKE